DVDTRTSLRRFLDSPGLSEATRRAYRVDVEEFTSWLRSHKTELQDVDVRVLADYAAQLGGSRPGRNPKRLAPATVARKLAAVRSFLRISLGPGRVPDVSLAPRRPRRLPDVPKQAEVDASLERLPADSPLTLRNRALAEFLYSA